MIINWLFFFYFFILPFSEIWKNKTLTRPYIFIFAVLQKHAFKANAIHLSIRKSISVVLHLSVFKKTLTTELIRDQLIRVNLKIISNSR